MVTEGTNRRKAKNLQYIRTANRAEVFRCLAISGPATRMELTAQLGLSKMAISNIVNELIEEALVHETEHARSQTPGRKSVELALQVDHFLAIGIYLSRDHVQAILADITGATRMFWQEPLAFPNPDLGEQNTSDLRDMLAHFYEKINREWIDACPQGQLLGIGLCSIGPLDLQSGVLLDPPNFFGIEMVELKTQLSEHFALPVWMDNDMNAAAWGEYLYGAAREHQHALYLGLGNGIGAGILSFGRIFQGSEGYGGEVGHMSIDLNGPACSCGQKGCLETYISLPFVLAKSGANDLTDLLDKSADSLFRKTWEPDFLRALIAGLINMVNIFDPEIILLGHSGAALVIDRLDQLEATVNRHAFQRRARKIKIELAQFGEKAPLAGSASLVFQAVFRGDLDPAAS